MAEVKPDGLSAVAAFFGTADERHCSDTGTPAAVAPPKHSRGRGGRTLGVGAGASLDGGGGGGGAKGGSDGGSAMGHNAAEDEDSIVRRLHRVSGRKRSAGGGRRGGGAWEEESDEEIDDGEGHDDDDLDEDEGRTSVVGSRRASKHVVVEDALGDVPAALVSKADASKRTKSERKVKDSDDGKQKEVDASASEPVPAEETNTGGESAKKRKPRRPKTRSRQKNIRKDKRRTMDKPEHLILGRSCYAGRVLTQETQKFLKLPPKKPRRETFGNSFHSRVRSGDEHDAVMGLAVDDLGKEGNVDTDGVANSEQGKTESKKKAKKKKSRYKNLMI